MIHRMPFNTSRASSHGRPRPSGRRGGSGIIAFTTAHCSSVRSMLSSRELWYPIYEMTSNQLQEVGTFHLPNFCRHCEKGLSRLREFAKMVLGLRSCSQGRNGRSETECCEHVSKRFQELHIATDGYGRSIKVTPSARSDLAGVSSRRCRRCGARRRATDN